MISKYIKQLVFTSFTEHYCIRDLKPQLLIDVSRLSEEEMSELNDFVRKGRVLSSNEERWIVEFEELPVITQEWFGRKNNQGQRYITKSDEYHVLSSVRNELMHIYDSPYGRAYHCKNRREFENIRTMKCEFLEDLEKLPVSRIMGLNQKELESPRDGRGMLELFESVLQKRLPTREEFGYLIIADLITLCKSVISMDLYEYHEDPHDGLGYSLKNNKKGAKIVRSIIGNPSWANWILYMKQVDPDLFKRENKNTLTNHQLTLEEKILAKVCSQEIFKNDKRVKRANEEFIRKEFGSDLSSEDVLRIWVELSLCLFRRQGRVKDLVNERMKKKNHDYYRLGMVKLLDRYKDFLKDGNQGTLDGLFSFLRNILKYSKSELIKFEKKKCGGRRSLPWEYKVYMCKKILKIFPGLLQEMVGMYEMYEFISRRLDDLREFPREWKECLQLIQPDLKFRSEKKKKKVIRGRNSFVMKFFRRKGAQRYVVGEEEEEEEDGEDSYEDEDGPSCDNQCKFHGIYKKKEKKE